MDSSTLFVSPKDSQTGLSLLSTHFTLRKCNQDFMRITGIEHDGKLPELLCVNTPGKVAPMVTFDNKFGHWFEGETYVFRPMEFDSLQDMILSIRSKVESAVKKYMLWDMEGTVRVTFSDNERFEERYGKDFALVSRHQQANCYSPFSVHTAQAYAESEKRRGREGAIYTMPSQSTIVTGILGGSSNNVALEMGFEEEEGVRNAAKREYDTALLGFVCAGHTSHSGDAGKSRRLCAYTRVRVVHSSILDSVMGSETGSPLEKDWIVYCMGYTCRVSYDTVWKIVYTMNSDSEEYYRKQFKNYSESTDSMCVPTYAIYEDQKYLYISISSGVVVRSIPGNSMIDSYMMKHQSSNTVIEHPQLPASGIDSLQYYYSMFFLLTPFAEHDRAPRGLLASGQTTQGQFFPWSPATARVSPLHASRPIVATQMARDIENDFESNPEAMWDIFPGEDLTVCYMNMPENFDDSMVVSQSVADRGAFSALSMCTYRISEQEKVPEIGETLCNKKYKWWKVDCTDTCVCKVRGTRRWISTSGRIPTGRVHSASRTEDGSMSIKVLSFSQMLTGDKISTTHGQKGVVRLVNKEDLPILIMKDGSEFIADIYIAVGTIVSRQTNGQIYESGYGLRGARDGVMHTVREPDNTHTDTCEYIMDPCTGKVIYRQIPSGKVEPIRATVGITRIIAQTQMTRERHHLTHKSEPALSTGTHSGRADGGGVRTAEMDYHAMYASGLRSCSQELFNRGNMSCVPVCKRCNAMVKVHDCGEEPDVAYVAMSYENVAFDQISTIVNGTTNRYQIQRM